MSTVAAASERRPICTVSQLPCVVTARGHVYWFHAVRKETTANDAIIGRVTGIATRRRKPKNKERVPPALLSKKTDPEFQFCSNWAYSDHMPEPVSAPVDFLSGDYSPQDSVNSARISARYLALQGKPWDLMAWSFTTEKGKDGATQKSAVQLQREAAVVLAMGGGFQAYFKQKRDGSVFDERVPVMAEVAKFCRARQAVCRQRSRRAGEPELRLAHVAAVRRLHQVVDAHHVRGDEVAHRQSCPQEEQREDGQAEVARGSSRRHPGGPAQK